MWMLKSRSGAGFVVGKNEANGNVPARRAQFAVSVVTDGTIHPLNWSRGMVLELDVDDE
jgi:hypothetical protein